MIWEQYSCQGKNNTSNTVGLQFSCFGMALWITYYLRKRAPNRLIKRSILIPYFNWIILFRGYIESSHSCLGICLCIIFFPLGLLCFFLMKNKLGIRHRVVRVPRRSQLSIALVWLCTVTFQEGRSRREVVFSLS